MDNDPIRELTEDEIKTYWDDGIVCVRNVISMDWIERMREALVRVLASFRAVRRRCQRSGDGRPLRPRDLDVHL